MAPGGTSPADFSVAPSAIRVEDSGAGEWRAVVYAGTDRGTVCFAAAVTGQSDEFPAGGTNCVAAAILGPELAPGGRGISLGQPSEARPPRFGSRIVYGLVGPEATAVEVTLGSATRPAVVDATVFQMTVGEAEREAIAKDGGTPPPAGEYGFRLFAAAFTEDEAPGDPLDFRVETKTTYADGTTATHTEPAVSRPPAESSPAGCYRTASTGSDVAVPGGSGTPLEICERFWRETGFEGTPRPERLVACHGSGSAPWVFPGGPGTCERLGLKPLVVAIIR
jgi:hypothetical protein